jgi:hypothetical protein
MWMLTHGEIGRAATSNACLEPSGGNSAFEPSSTSATATATSVSCPWSELVVCNDGVMAPSPSTETRQLSIHVVVRLCSFRSLRDYIKATAGFEKLGEATGTPAKSLIRMLGPRGNPQARNLFGIIGYLQKQAGVELPVVPGSH